MLPEEVEHERLPPPFEHLIGSPAHHPCWGPGWLGYYAEAYDENTDATFWYVCETTGEVARIQYDVIFKFEDGWTSLTWLIFYDADLEMLFPFVVNPTSGVTPRAVCPKLREFLA